MYCPSAGGYILRIGNTAHQGTTLLLPWLSLPNLHREEKLKSSARMSHQALMKTSRMSLSRQILLNACNLVIQATLLQQTFSISFSIGQHTLHLHHSGEVSPGLGEGGGGGGGAFFSWRRFWQSLSFLFP